MISSPVFVLIVTLLSLSLVVGGSAVSVGRGGGCDDSLVRCCFGKLGSADDASLPLFVGDGSAGLEWQLVGAVAIGESANAGVGRTGVELDGADGAGTGIDGIAGASPICDGAAAVAGSAVCVASVVVTGLLLG